jgi:hypothetical protein
MYSVAFPPCKNACDRPSELLGEIEILGAQRTQNPQCYGRITGVNLRAIHDLAGYQRFLLLNNHTGYYSIYKTVSKLPNPEYAVPIVANLRPYHSLSRNGILPVFGEYIRSTLSLSTIGRTVLF